jgi:hypothetical protein
MIRASLISHHQLRSGPEGSLTGPLTNVVAELPLTPGVWTFSATTEYNLQLNMAPGEGMGTKPGTWFGFRNTVASGKLVIYDGDWGVLRVPVGSEGYLVVRKAFVYVPDGTYYLNRIAR